MTPADKLARRIAEALAKPPDRAALDSLAAEYARWCRAANRRLEQCATMLAQGNESEAIQLAETAPVLLDLVAALSFAESEPWREFCEARKLTQADPLDERAIRQLQDLYSRGISANHPLYKQYRAAIADREDFRALIIAQAIVRLNPADQSAQVECKRQEAKVRQQFLTQLQAAAAANDTAKTMTLLGQRDQIAWEEPPTGQAVATCEAMRSRHLAEQAQAECANLLPQMRQHRAAGDWQNTLTLARRVESLRSQHGIKLGGRADESYHELHSWAEGHDRNEDAKRRFAAAVETVQRALALEAGSSAGQRPDSNTALERHTQLVAAWQELESVGLPLPDELKAQYVRRRAALERQIRARQYKRALTIGMAAAAGVCLVVGAGFALIMWSRARNATEELCQCQQRRQVVLAEKRLRQLKELKPPLVIWPPLAGQVPVAEAWLKEEQSLNQQWSEAVVSLNALAKTNFTGVSLPALVEQFARAGDRLKPLAPDFKAPAEATWIELCRQRDMFLKGQQTRIEQECYKLLARGEAAAATLQTANADRTQAQARQALQELSDTLAEWDRLYKVCQPPVVTIPMSLVERAEKLRPAIKPARIGLHKLENFYDNMRQATNLTQYLSALDHYTGSKFLSTTEAGQGRAVLKARTLLERIGAIAAVANDPAARAQLRREMKPDILPVPETELKVAERMVVLRLRDDENLHNIYRYDLAPERNELRAELAFARGEARFEGKVSDGSKERIRFSGQFFVVTPHTRLAQPVFAERSLLCRQVGGLTPEADLFNRCRLGRLTDSTVKKFDSRTCLLQLLDNIAADRLANPLFKAYLLLKLYELIAARPVEWGAAAMPNLRADHEALLAGGGRDLQSGDWMIPVKVDARKGELERFFAGLRANSYVQQARFLRQLRASFFTQIRYAGFVGLDGRPALAVEPHRTGQLLGLAEQRLKLASLFVREPQASPPWKQMRQPQLLTPLLAAPADEQLVKEAAARCGLPLGESPPAAWLASAFESEE